MPDATPRQKRLLAAPAVGVVLLAAGGFAWGVGGFRVPGMVLGVLGVAAILWGVVGQVRDPVLRARGQPPMRGGGGSEGGR